ncbi:Disulfide bond formation protein D precursor [Microbacterium oxydans]|uniref:Disulfide bond formation protein D n=1 Tax=Microbacterium oxydans TaxID=82380 RepID=A0A0F0KMS9_9MICO|nr:thioredoxin domain-containing protein [Microbacterium oxydans]KJL20576.1 Disulfide bond formation protein D precursor [Microbacterium oxydans]
MKNSVKATLVAIAVAIVLLIAGIVFAISQQQPAAPSTEGEPQQTVRTDSHVLDDGGEGAVTVVEFLDFECEACGAFYPVVEDLREKYDGEITYVVRYFPLPGHINSTQAALAAEAAAQQDRFEDMYHRLFETQAQWGEQPEETPEVFRGLADELGLDMAAYDAAIADPATAERVQSDKRDGEKLGVNSTPTFFVAGEKVVLQEWDDLEEAIEKAVNG